MGGKLISTKPKKNILQADISFGKVSLTARSLFAEHLSVMLKSGLTITDALTIGVESNRGKMKKVLKKVLKSVESGNSFSSALARHPKTFSGLFINAVRAGETSGTLEENLSHVAEQLAKEKELVSKIKGAMLYPVVVLTASFVLGMVLSFVVLPKITPLFTGLKMELPFTTRALISFSAFVESHGTELFLGIIGGVIFLVWLLKQRFMNPITHWFLLHFPIVKNITRSANLARFSRTLGTLLKSGLNVDEAVAITGNTVDNHYFQGATKSIANSVGKGTTLSSNMERYSRLFPIMPVRMVRVGEESGRVDETLLYLAHFYELEVDNSTKALSTAIEPVLLLFIGLVVGFLALSIITPIYNITGNVRR